VINTTLRYVFFLCIVRPVVLVVLGLNVRRRELLPRSGPAIVVANHNSHLDALTLMTLFGLRQLPIVRPVAAIDYFLRSKWSTWFSTKIIGIIPLKRDVSGDRTDPLAGISEALAAGNILILFPEGSRGQPEQLETFKTGVAHIAKRHPEVPVVPVFLHGLGKSLPRGEGILVPFFCDVFVGESIAWTGSRDGFMCLLGDRIKSLANEGNFPQWS
jgi:1-acyl-sn-glycerol-3-phosphate acyltransferase